MVENAAETRGSARGWRRRFTYAGIYGLFAALAGTGVLAAGAPAASLQSSPGASVVSITCPNGTWSVAVTEDAHEPGKPVKYRGTGNCEVSGTENGKAKGVVTFTIDRNNCVNGTTQVTGTIKWPSGDTSTVELTVVWTATADRGITGSISEGFITSGAYAGAMLDGIGTALEEVRANCVEQGTFDGASGTGSGSATGAS
ncbi:hypothetical protein [Streptomyces halobius]|uniref:Polyketide cyclase/dehydrase/lipid transport protein n=1 Tax=Streptomyces halobius TaxID=2879846 RepID=A0ABY4M0I6_9ACTN|nr:hypothetical protein [Streptomyces halobius]UQA90643.1 hypothetical protein K9S39_00860 [Streptomyces halobius]